MAVSRRSKSSSTASAGRRRNMAKAFLLSWATAAPASGFRVPSMIWPPASITAVICASLLTAGHVAEIDDAGDVIWVPYLDLREGTTEADADALGQSLCVANAFSYSHSRMMKTCTHGKMMTNAIVQPDTVGDRWDGTVQIRPDQLLSHLSRHDDLPSASLGYPPSAVELVFAAAVARRTPAMR